MKLFTRPVWLPLFLGLGCLAALFSGCGRSGTPGAAREKLPDWPRPEYKAGTGRALVFYVVYGRFTNDFAIARLKYRTEGLPAAVTMQKLERNQSGGPLPFTNRELEKMFADKPLFEQAGQAPECIVLRGEIPDPPDLNYLRDTIGVVTFLMDHGGVAVCDPQQLEMYGADRWQSEIFRPDVSNLSQHVRILYSDEPDGRWYHTRGMRKFARPDISVRGVPPEYSDPAKEICGRFIYLQALGGRIQEGQEVVMASIPPGLICRHEGNPDDPDFNNAHVEIRWPARR